jgi:hypothetical protein
MWAIAPSGTARDAEVIRRSGAARLRPRRARTASSVSHPDGRVGALSLDSTSNSLQTWRAGKSRALP